VENPRRKKGGIAATRAALRHSDLRVRDIIKDAWTAMRTFT
jgi:hypothetical protein